MKNPWANFDPPSCFPDNCQCEGAREAWIRLPSSFWSSLAYIFAALALYRFIKIKSQELKLWTGVCIILGLSSMVGHATHTKLALAFDFSSIILILSFFALLNLFLLLRQSYKKIIFYFTLYYFSLFAMMYSMDKWAKIGICVLIFTFSLSDIMREMGRSFLKARSLQLSLLVLCVSFGFFLLDEFHIMCDPESWFQFHSLWHIGTAISIYYYGKWRFEKV